MTDPPGPSSAVKRPFANFKILQICRISFHTRPDMIILVPPVADSLTEGVSRAIKRLPDVDPHAFHQRVAAMYSWEDVANRTQDVYSHVLSEPRDSLYQIIRSAGSCGPIQGVVVACMVALCWIVVQFLDWIQPVEEIDLALDLPKRQTRVSPRSSQRRPSPVRFGSIREAVVQQGLLGNSLGPVEIGKELFQEAMAITREKSHSSGSAKKGKGSPKRSPGK